MCCFIFVNLNLSFLREREFSSKLIFSFNKCSSTQAVLLSLIYHRVFRQIGSSIVIVKIVKRADDIGRIFDVVK